MFKVVSYFQISLYRIQYMEVALLSYHPGGLRGFTSILALSGDWLVVIPQWLPSQPIAVVFKSEPANDRQKLVPDARFVSGATNSDFRRRTQVELMASEKEPILRLHGSGDTEADASGTTNASLVPASDVLAGSDRD